MARPEPASPSTLSLSPELWVQKGKSNRPPYAQNVSLTPYHNKGYFGCAQPCSLLLSQTSSLGKMPSFFLLLPQNKQKTHLRKRRHTFVISALRRLRKEDSYEFKAILGHSDNHETKATDSHLGQGQSAPVLSSLCSSKSPGPQSKTCSAPAPFAQSKFPPVLHYKEHFSVTLLALVFLSTDFPGLISTSISSIQYFAWPSVILSLVFS